MKLTEIFIQRYLRALLGDFHFGDVADFVVVDELSEEERGRQSRAELLDDVQRPAVDRSNQVHQRTVKRQTMQGEKPILEQNTLARLPSFEDLYLERSEELDRNALHIAVVELEDARMSVGVDLADQSSVPVFALRWTRAVIADAEYLIPLRRFAKAKQNEFRRRRGAAKRNRIHERIGVFVVQLLPKLAQSLAHQFRMQVEICKEIPSNVVSLLLDGRRTNRSDR